MAIRPIRLFGDPILRKPAIEVVEFDSELRQLVTDLSDTMLDAPGAGLAAPQIGVGLRVFTWQMDNDDGVPARGVIVNPYVTATKPSVDEPDPHDEAEGCLSVPGESFPLKRGDRATVTGFDVDGGELSFEASGWFARCMQHEYDHLNGVLYVDRLTGKWSRKARKAVKGYGRAHPSRSP